MRFPTFVIGPKTAGRNYTILAASEPMSLAADASERLNILPESLAGWASAGETDFVALIPLSRDQAPALLIRAAYTGRASGGTLAYANAVLIDDDNFDLIDGRPDRLLALIPVPDGSLAFGRQPLIVDEMPHFDRPGLSWRGLGLAWQDRLVVVPGPAEREPMIGMLLDSIVPVEQRSRVRGWATTAVLPSSGSFAPLREFQLIVIDGDQRHPANSSHLLATADGDDFIGERFDESESWRAAQRLYAMNADDGEIHGRIGGWSVALGDQPPAIAIDALVRATMPRLGGEARMRLITRMATEPGEFGEIFTPIAQMHLSELIATSPPNDAAFYIDKLFESHSGAIASFGPLGALLVKPGIGTWIISETMSAMIANGFVEGLAQAEASLPLLLDGYGEGQISLLLSGISDRIQAGGAFTNLAVRILSLLSNQVGDRQRPPFWLDAYAALFADLIRHGSDDDLKSIANHEMIQLAQRVAPNAAVGLARGIRLTDASNVTQLLIALDAALAIDRFERERA